LARWLLLLVGDAQQFAQRAWWPVNRPPLNWN